MHFGDILSGITALHDDPEVNAALSSLATSVSQAVSAAGHSLVNIATSKGAELTEDAANAVAALGTHAVHHALGAHPGIHIKLPPTTGTLPTDPFHLGDVDKLINKTKGILKEQ